jgi:protein FrlC
MKYSICSVIYGSCGSFLPTYTLEDTMRRLARVGFDAVEIVCSSPHAWPFYMGLEKRAQVNEWKKKYGIEVSSVMAQPGGGPATNAASSNKTERAFAIRYIKECIDMASLWGCKNLAYVAGWYLFGTKKQEAWNNTLDTLKQIASYALDKGVNICIEPTSTDSNVIDCPDDGLLLMEQSGFQNVGLMFDMAHAFYRNEDPVDYIYTIGKNLKHIHLTDYDRRPPGTNGADFYPVMQALKDINYQGYVTMEIGFNRTTGADSVSRQSIEFLKSIEAQL